MASGPSPTDALLNSATMEDERNGHLLKEALIDDDLEAATCAPGCLADPQVRLLRMKCNQKNHFVDFFQAAALTALVHRRLRLFLDALGDERFRHGHEYVDDHVTEGLPRSLLSVAIGEPKTTKSHAGSLSLQNAGETLATPLS